MLDRFLQTQHFRHRQTRRIYVCVLRQFQSFVSQHGAGAPPSVSILQQWLRERRQKWPLHMVCHRARLVERFLCWLHAAGAISTNPFAELHRHYGVRTTPIVRALLGEEVEAALRELRPFPRFSSFLGKLMEEHVAQMRSRGYRYDVNEGMLLRFDRFLQGHRIERCAAEKAHRALERKRPLSVPPVRGPESRPAAVEGHASARPERCDLTRGR